jgi:5-methylthioadenosine/S-adenosylhomocysteine deaminase
MNGKKKNASILIKNARYLIKDAYTPAIENGAVAIKENRIVEIGTTADLEAKYQAGEVVDAGNKIIMPGLVDSHNHLGNWNMYAILGLYENQPIAQPGRLLKIIYPAYTLVEEEACYDVNMLGYLNAIKTGTTTVSNAYIWPDQLARASIDSGLRVDLAPCLHQTICHPDSNGPEDDLIRTEAMIQKWHGAANGRIQYRIQPEITFFCEEWFFEECAKLAAKYDVGLGTHAAEDTVSTAKAAKIWPGGEIRKMHRLGFMGPKTLFFHSCVLDDYELDLYAETGTSVAHCPVSNLKRGLVARVPEMLAKGIKVGLGNDYPNNDLFNAMRITSLIHTILDRDPKGISERQAFELATQGGANALSIGDQVGSLDPGKKADIIMLDVSTNTRLFPLTAETVVNMIRLNGSGSDVSDVIVDGNFVMRNKKVLTVDEEKVVENARTRQEEFITRYKKMESDNEPLVQTRMALPFT